MFCFLKSINTWTNPLPFHQKNVEKPQDPKANLTVNSSISLGETIRERGTSEHYYGSLAKYFSVYFVLVRLAWFPGYLNFFSSSRKPVFVALVRDHNASK